MKYSRAIQLCWITALPAVSFPGPVFSGSTTLTDSFGSLGGGEFLASSATLTFQAASLGEVPGRFETYCLEEFEDVTFGLAYMADLNDRTVASPTNPNYAGGLRGGFQDPVSNQTAWLYSRFVLGTLGGYSYVPGAARVSSADSLQIAIWALEDERPVPNIGTQARSFYDAANIAVLGGYVNSNVFALLCPKDSQNGAPVRNLRANGTPWPSRLVHAGSSGSRSLRPPISRSSGW